jgi:hypothetical protein
MIAAPTSRVRLLPSTRQLGNPRLIFADIAAILLVTQQSTFVAHHSEVLFQRGFPLAVLLAPAITCVTGVVQVEYAVCREAT